MKTAIILLGTLLDSNRTALDLQPKEVQLLTEERAILWKALHTRKASEGTQVEATRECVDLKKDDFVCDYLVNGKRLLFTDTSINKPRTRLTRKTRNELKKAFLNGSIDKFHYVEESQTRKVLESIPRVESFETSLEKLSEDATCGSATLAFVTATRLETFFPDEELKKKAFDLYTKASQCVSDDMRIRAHFRAALLALWDRDCTRALPHLEPLRDPSVIRNYRSRALYWTQRCHHTMGKEELASELKEQLAVELPFSLHSLLLQSRSTDWIKPFYSKQDTEILTRSENTEINKFIAAAEALLSIGEPNLARLFLENSLDLLSKEDPKLKMYHAYLYNRAGNYIDKFKILAPLFREHTELISNASLRLLFPKNEEPYKLSDEVFKKIGIDSLLVFSLIRQESAFNPRAQSAAGARGLMQILPSTARQISRVSRDKLFDPETNVKVGSKYFKWLLKRYDGDVEFALVAYNAGATRMNQWKKRYPTDNRILFLDLLPFQETREYVASIARNYFWYSTLYDALVTETLQKEEAHPYPKDLTQVFRVFGSHDTSLAAKETLEDVLSRKPTSQEPDLPPPQPNHSP